MVRRENSPISGGGVAAILNDAFAPCFTSDMKLWVQIRLRCAHLHHSVVSEQWWVTCMVRPQWSQLICQKSLSDCSYYPCQLVAPPPLPVIIVPDEADYYCHNVNIFNNVACSGPGEDSEIIRMNNSGLRMQPWGELELKSINCIHAGCFCPSGVASSNVIQRRWHPQWSCLNSKQTGVKCCLISHWKHFIIIGVSVMQWQSLRQVTVNLLGTGMMLEFWKQWGLMAGS